MSGFGRFLPLRAGGFHFRSCPGAVLRQAPQPEAKTLIRSAQLRHPAFRPIAGRTQLVTEIAPTYLHRSSLSQSHFWCRLAL